jgi:hypothetical protein
MTNPLDQVPSWFKIVLGVAGLLISWKVFPVLELLNLFLLIVVVPVCIIGSGWLIADGATEAIGSTWGEVMERARELAANQEEAA